MEVTQIQSSVYQSQICQSLKNHYESGLLCDVTLTTGDGQGTECHKVLLSAASSYFKQILCDSNTQTNHIDVSPMNIDDVREIVSFMYSGVCLLDCTNVITILGASMRWFLPLLTEECLRYIKKHINHDNVCQWYECSSELANEQLSEIWSHYIREHFTELHHSKKALIPDK